MDIIRRAAWRVPPRQRRPIFRRSDHSPKRENTAPQQFYLFLCVVFKKFLSDTDKSPKFVIADSRRSGRERARGAYASFATHLSRESFWRALVARNSTRSGLKTDHLFRELELVFSLTMLCFLSAIRTLSDVTHQLHIFLLKKSEGRIRPSRIKS